MKKFLALVIAFMLFICTVSVGAAETVTEEAADNQQYVLGSIGDYNLVYIYDESLKTTENCRVIGNYYFYTDVDELKLYLSKDGELFDVSSSYGAVFGDDTLDSIVATVNLYKENGFLPFKDWNIINMSQTATEPQEATMDEGNASASEPMDTPPAPMTSMTTAPAQVNSEPLEEHDVPTDEPTNCLPDPWETVKQPTTDITDAAATEPTTKSPTQMTTAGPVSPSNQPVAYPTAKTDNYVDFSFNTRKVDVKKLNLVTGSLEAGDYITLYVSGTSKDKVSYSSSNKKVVKVSQKGKVLALKKGFAKITAKVGKKKYYFTAKVISDPKLQKTSITVKKGKYKKIKLTGKASTIKNKYKNTKIAKFVGKGQGRYIKIKGLKRGKTTLKIRVNGLWLKLKVKVK